MRLCFIPLAAVLHSSGCLLDALWLVWFDFPAGMVLSIERCALGPGQPAELSPAPAQDQQLSITHTAPCPSSCSFCACRIFGAQGAGHDRRGGAGAVPHRPRPATRPPAGEGGGCSWEAAWGRLC